MSRGEVQVGDLGSSPTARPLSYVTTMASQTHQLGGRTGDMPPYAKREIAKSGKDIARLQGTSKLFENTRGMRTPKFQYSVKI